MNKLLLAAVLMMGFSFTSFADECAQERQALLSTLKRAVNQVHSLAGQGCTDEINRLMDNVADIGSKGEGNTVQAHSDSVSTCEKNNSNAIVKMNCIAGVAGQVY